MRTILGFVALIVLLIGGYLATVIVPVSGMLDKYETMLVAQCDRLDIAPGTEDIVIDYETNLAFVSSADRRAWYQDGGSETAPPVKGGIFVVDLDNPTGAIRVSPDSLDDFLPHGIDLWRGEDGKKRLFVVNHPSTGEEIIEIFDVGEGGLLTHLESVSFDEMYSPNDVVAVGPKQFYATNDRRYDEGVLASLEMYFALPLTSIVYFDGVKGRIVQEGMVYANGINQSNNGKAIYVSEVMKRRVSVFERDVETNELTKVKKIKINTAPDNIDVDQSGMLWIGGHPQAMKFAGHAENASAISPSHVVKIDPGSGDYKDVFISLDGEINASSVGAVHDGKLLVGAVFDPHIMVCPLS